MKALKNFNKVKESVNQFVNLLCQEIDSIPEKDKEWDCCKDCQARAETAKAKVKQCFKRGGVL